MYRKNVAGQFLYFGLVNATTGAALTGATVTAYRALGSAAQAAATGTTTELGNGQYRFALSQADTNADNGSYLFTATSAVPVEKTVVFTAADPTDTVRFGLTALPNAAAGASGGVFIVGGTGVALAAAGLDAVVVETGLNARQALALNSAALAGVLSGAATTSVTVKGAGVATTRITATVDTDGNRSALVLNPPA